MTLHRVFDITWLLAVAAFGSWIAVMAADDVKPYEYDAAKSYITPDPAPQNSVITVNWALAKVNRSCPGTLQRYFRDLRTGQIVATLDATPALRAVKKTDKYLPRSFTLPPNLPPVVGYSSEICAECNVLQKVFPLCFTTPEITFRVLQNDAMPR